MKRHHLYGACALALMGLSGCGPSAVDPHRQIGANPTFRPSISISCRRCTSLRSCRGMAQRPQSRRGLKVTAFATGLANPRSVYVLPNGDVLVVESGGPPAPIHRPKEIVMNWIEAMTHSRTQAGPAHPALPR